MNNLGTPKSLKQSIFNSFEAKQTLVSADMVDLINKKVRDFISQKFQTALLDNDNPEVTRTIVELWFSITGEKI